MSSYKKPSKRPREPNIVDEHVGRRIRIRRTILGITQKELSDHLSITFQQVQKYENGKNRISAGTLYEISQFLAVSVAYFYEDLQYDTDPAVLSVREPLLEFISTNEGMHLNRAFRAIEDEKIRRELLKFMRVLSKLPPDGDSQS